MVHVLLMLLVGLGFIALWLLFEEGLLWEILAVVVRAAINGVTYLIGRRAPP